MAKAKSVLLVLMAILVAASFTSSSAARRDSGAGSVGCNDGTVSWAPTDLWPPNHKLQTATIVYDENDEDGDTITITVDSIQHDQADPDGSNELNGSGNPNAGLDWGGVGNTGTAKDPDAATATALIRAERSGRDKTGRDYSVTVTCVDTGDNSGDTPQMETVTLVVSVAHDCRNGC